MRTGSGRAGGGDAVYAMGLFGAAFYYFTHFHGLWGFLWAFAQTLFWPAFVIYDLLMHLH
jgi:hypothetical protein